MRSAAGFTILELIVAIALSSVIALALFNTFLSSSRSVAVINEKTSYEVMASTLYHQFEKDISGACIPIQFLVQLKEEEKKKKEAEKEKTQGAKPDQPAQQQPKPPADQKKEKEIPPLKKVFFSTSDKDVLKQLTFITRNALAFYTDKEQKDVTPLLVRVMYQVKEDKDEPGTYILLRSQGAQLGPDGYEDEKKIRAYELTRGIKKMKVTFYKEVVKKDDGQAQKKDEQQPPEDDKKKSEQKKEFSTVASWSTDAQENGQALLPWFVEFEMTLDHEGVQHEERFMFQVAVADKNDIMASLPKESAAPAPKAGSKGQEQVTPQSIQGGKRGQGAQRQGQRQQPVQRQASPQRQQPQRQSAPQPKQPPRGAQTPAKPQAPQLAKQQAPQQKMSQGSPPSGPMQQQKGPIVKQQGGTKK